MNLEKREQKITESLNKQIDKLNSYSTDRLYSELTRLERENKFGYGTYRSILIDDFKVSEGFYKQTIRTLLKAVKTVLIAKLKEEN